MGKVFTLPLWLIVAIFIYILLWMGIAWYFFWIWIKGIFMDKVVFIDKSNRWSMAHTNLKGKDSLDVKDKKYILNSETGLLNSRGKALYIFTEGKSNPLHIERDNAHWLDAKSVMGYIQNKNIQKVVTPQDKFIDMLIIMGAIGGILACLASVVNVLIATGVIKP